MNTNRKLRPLVLATSLALAGTAAVPFAAQAEVSSDLTISSMYLWRGLDISDGKPVLSSTIKYSHASGFYAGTWFSNEGTPGASFGQSYELDLFAGYAGKAGGLGYDIGYFTYLYPEAPGSISASDISEIVLGLSYGDFSFGAYVNTDATASNDYKYYSLNYSIGKVGLHYGLTSSSVAASEYSDINVSYAVTDKMKWTLSKASGDAIAAGGTTEDLLVMVAYSVPL